MYGIQSLRAQHAGDSFQTQINRAGCGFFRGEMRRFAAFPPLSLKRKRAKKLHDWGLLLPLVPAPAAVWLPFSFLAKTSLSLKRKGTKKFYDWGLLFSAGFCLCRGLAAFFLLAKTSLSLKRKGTKKLRGWGLLSPAGFCLCRGQFFRSPNKKEGEKYFGWPAVFPLAKTSVSFPVLPKSFCPHF